ncbi:hypothetical protein CBR_g27827 [Chara braunii]|uniref:Uncharacterized protein n=1 Tax=Chara braunii TaxID=69332 RepID=A0A388L8N5_CHABU|nr:hypothetical protein CBR_g27827 [Chara braunii]|eukprot:GBG78602.1 hypothetical protein CBR_g27827 [Chara braunii]
MTSTASPKYEQISDNVVASSTSGRSNGGRTGGAGGGGGGRGGRGGRVVRAGGSQSGEVEVGMEKWDRRGKSGSGDRGGDRWGEIVGKEVRDGEGSHRKEVGGGRSEEGGRRREMGSGERGGDPWREAGIGGEVGIDGGKLGSGERGGDRWREVREGTLGSGRKSAKGGLGREVG